MLWQVNITVAMQTAHPPLGNDIIQMIFVVVFVINDGYADAGDGFVDYWCHFIDELLLRLSISDHMINIYIYRNIDHEEPAIIIMNQSW